MILTAGKRFKLRTVEAHQTRARKLLVQHGLPPISDWTPVGTIQARIYRSKWVADCPTCPGFVGYVDPDWPFLVDISGCGKLYAVEFPKDRAKIEAELLKRPAPQNRGWWPHETVDDLRRESKENI